jgi:hypothetical protein
MIYFLFYHLTNLYIHLFLNLTNLNNFLYCYHLFHHYYYYLYDLTNHVSPFFNWFFNDVFPFLNHILHVSSLTNHYNLILFNLLYFYFHPFYDLFLINIFDLYYQMMMVIYHLYILSKFNHLLVDILLILVLIHESNPHINHFFHELYILCHLLNYAFHSYIHLISFSTNHHYRILFN